MHSQFWKTYHRFKAVRRKFLAGGGKTHFEELFEDILLGKHILLEFFWGGATAPLAPPLCTAMVSTLGK